MLSKNDDVIFRPLARHSFWPPNRSGARRTGRPWHQPQACPGSPGSPGCWVSDEYPLVMTNIAMENGHRNSEFSHEKLWFSIVMLNYQRVSSMENPLEIMGNHRKMWENSDILLPGWWCNKHLEKWWSSSMGRMTSHIWWKIKNVPNHQADY